MRRLPPLNALRMFEATARSASFSAAAETLCVTHGAISHQIRLLEDWIGQPLFVRGPAGVRLTEAGAALQQAASQAFALLEARCAELAKTRAPQELVLAAPGSFLAHWLIPRLEHFEHAHPQIRLRLQSGGTLDELASRRVDALILAGEPPWPRTLATTSLIDETVGPVCAPHWTPLPETPVALAGLPRLHTASRPGAWGDWAGVLGLDPASFAAGRQFDHLPLMLEAAASGLGFAIAPALLVERELAQGRLIAPLGFVPSRSAFTLCVESVRCREASLAALQRWLVAEASGLRDAAI